MAQKRSKKHHLVPKALQRPFCFEKERVWFTERGSDGCFVEPEIRNIESTFQIRDYYTIQEEGRPSDRVEREHFGEIDDFLGDFVNEIVRIFAKNKIPQVNGNDLVNFRWVVWQLLKRNGEFSKANDDEEEGRKLIDEVIAKVRKAGDPNGELVGLLRRQRDPVALKKEGRDIRVGAITHPSPKVSEEMRKFDFRWAVSHASHSFVLASLPVYRIGNGGTNGLANPDVEIWLPITPKHAAVLVRDSAGKIPILNEIGRDKIREINEFAKHSCRGLISHSQVLLKSLVK